MDGDAQITLRTLPGLGAVAPKDWDALANPNPATFNPFVSWNFLEALERSGSATARTGWAPSHVILEDADGRLAAAAPAYVKSHSYGEYVFDHGWADAFERAGGRYYPKLQVTTPFTPATAPRLLIGDGEPGLAAMLGDALAAVTRRLGLSSAHVTFLPKDQQDMLVRRGWLARMDQQFHFDNRGYRDFEDFLDALASRKRKNLKKERQKAAENAISIRWKTGNDIKEADWDVFFAFYMDTGARKWGRPYLTRAFFSLIGERMAENALLVLAYRGDRPIAGALNFIGGDTLFGRHWGCLEHHPFLHFEVCYYQAIDFAIAHGLKRVEAGAQGAHKLARGYEPAPVRSAHFITNPGFRDAVADYLAREREAVAYEIEHLAEHGPFKKAD